MTDQERRPKRCQMGYVAEQRQVMSDGFPEAETGIKDNGGVVHATP